MEIRSKAHLDYILSGAISPPILHRYKTTSEVYRAAEVMPLSEIKRLLKDLPADMELKYLLLLSKKSYSKVKAIAVHERFTPLPSIKHLESAWETYDILAQAAAVCHPAAPNFWVIDKYHSTLDKSLQRLIKERFKKSLNVLESFKPANNGSVLANFYRDVEREVGFRDPEITELVLKVRATRLPGKFSHEIFYSSELMTAIGTSMDPHKVCNPIYTYDKINNLWVPSS